MPRTKVVEPSKAIAELFEGTEDVLCVITKDALEGIINEKTKLHCKLHDVHKSICERNKSISESNIKISRSFS